MNKLELFQARNRNLNLLSLAYRPKINAIEIDVNNTYKHEYTKWLCSWAIRNGMENKHLQTIVDTGENLVDFKNKFEEDWRRPSIVTEARFNDKLRADIFNLDTGTVIEIVNTETYESLKRKKDRYMLMGLEFIEVNV